MAVAAAPTPAGLVHSTLAEAGHPSPTAGLRHPTGHHAIAPESLLRPDPEAGHRGRQTCGCLVAVHLVRLDGPGVAEARLDGPGVAEARLDGPAVTEARPDGPAVTEAHPVRQDSPAARACRDLLDRRWRAGVLVRRMPRPHPYQWRLRREQPRWSLLRPVASSSRSSCNTCL
jgi:hypothetical protein